MNEILLQDYHGVRFCVVLQGGIIPKREGEAIRQMHFAPTRDCHGRQDEILRCRPQSPWTHFQE